MVIKTLYFKLSKGYCFLLGTKDGYMLVDSGYDYDNKLFDAEMKLQEIGVLGRVIYTPGYTIDSVCILIGDISNPWKAISCRNAKEKSWTN